MDKDRQIRLLVPPFFAIASVLWAAHLSGDLLSLLHIPTGTEAASVQSVLAVLAVGAATLPAGYAIGAVTIFTLRWPLRRIFPLRNYEVPVSENAMAAILTRLQVPGRVDFRLCAAATFDHVQLHPEIHKWLLRRWNTFNVSTQCVTALLLAIPVGLAFGICFFEKDMWKWWTATVLLSLVLMSNAAVAWREVRTMIDFALQAPATLRPPRAGADSSTPPASPGKSAPSQSSA